MPRATLSITEQRVLSAALLDYAKTNNLSFGDALVAAALTTMGELHTVATQFLNTLRTQKVAALNAVPGQATAAQATLTAEIADIDSTLLKV